MNIKIYYGYERLSTNAINGWLELFKNCFNVNEAKCIKALEKYKINSCNAVFCFAFNEGRIVASYSGFVFNPNGIKMMLSTDTMSNGELRNATVKLASVLYNDLKEKGIRFVCGFPNKNIENIRVKKLGWIMSGSMSFYIGIPVIWRFFQFNKIEVRLWNLTRPCSGYMIKPNLFIRLLGREFVYEGNFISLIGTLASSKPGLFFIKLPHFIVKAKKFGYLILNESDVESIEYAITVSNLLDLNTIDVP